MSRSSIVGEGEGVRQTSGFPEGHLDGELRNAEVRFGDRGGQTVVGTVSVEALERRGFGGSGR